MRPRVFMRRLSSVSFFWELFHSFTWLSHLQVFLGVSMYMHVLRSSSPSFEIDFTYMTPSGSRSDVAPLKLIALEFDLPQVTARFMHHQDTLTASALNFMDYHSVAGMHAAGFSSRSTCHDHFFFVSNMRLSSSSHVYVCMCVC